MTHPTSASPLEDVEKLRKALVENLSNFAGNAILGAQLGTRLNTLLAPSTYKTWLNEGNQNLRAFAETFLVGIVTPTTQRQGQDYLFQIEGKSLQVTQSFSGALWKAFCVVQPTLTIRFKRTESTLYLTPIGSDDATEDPTIEPVSIAEHKAICQAFAKNPNSDGRANQKLVDVANGFEPHNYAVWVDALKSEVGLFQKWGSFRVARIKDLFAQRVQALTTDEVVRTRLASEFEADHQSKFLTKSGSTTVPLAPTVASTIVSRSTEHGARQALAKALEMLDDTQIARILVPLDVVAALLAHRKH